MTHDVSDMIVTPCRILYHRTPSIATLPAITLAADGTWPTGWIQLGYTTAPLSVQYDFDEIPIEIQESLAMVNSFKTKETLDVETSLAEFDISQVAVGLSAPATGGSSINTSGSAISHEIAMGNNNSQPQYMWGFEGKRLNSTGALVPIRMFIWLGIASKPGKLEFGKAVHSAVGLHIKAVANMYMPASQQLFKIQNIVTQ